MKNIDTQNNRTREGDFRKLNTEEKIMAFTSGLSVPEKISKEKAFENLMLKIENSETPVVEFKPNYFRYLAVAASILLVAGMFYSYFSRQIITISTSNAKQLVYNLPDGSTININAGSEITYKKYGFTSNRQLTMKGEAFFQIKKGKKFEIKTENGIVTILGTSLNICSREKTFKVSCLTGKVKVQASNNQVIIAPGESVNLIDNSLQKVTGENIQTMAQWRNGEFNFENTPLSSIFDEIERQFDVKIESPIDVNRHFTGSFSNKSLNEALDIVCIPMQLTYEIKTDKSIVVTKQAK